MLASLFNIPSDQIGLSQFSFANADHHNQIRQAIQSTYNVTLTGYVIDPMPMNALGVWLYNHQAMHNEQNAVLGINGNDFTDLDFTKSDQVSDWIYLHAQEHYQAAQKLGL